MGIADLSVYDMVYEFACSATLYTKLETTVFVLKDIQ